MKSLYEDPRFINSEIFTGTLEEMVDAFVEHASKQYDEIMLKEQEAEQSPASAAAPKPGDIPAASGPADDDMKTKEKPSDDLQFDCFASGQFLSAWKRYTAKVKEYGFEAGEDETNPDNIIFEIPKGSVKI